MWITSKEDREKTNETMGKDGGEQKNMGYGRRRKETQGGGYKKEPGVAGKRVDQRRITNGRLFDNVLMAS